MFILTLLIWTLSIQRPLYHTRKQLGTPNIQFFLKNMFLKALTPDGIVSILFVFLFISP